MLPFMIILLVSALGSFFVLAISGVGDNLLLMQAGFYAAAVVLLIAQHSWQVKSSNNDASLASTNLSPKWLTPCLILLVVALGATLFSSQYPARWLNLAGFILYMSAVLMPPLMVLIAFNFVEANASKLKNVVAMATAIVLAMQPDLAQVTALLVALSVLLAFSSQKTQLVLLLVVTLVCAAWAGLQHDPLKPVSYVEGVFKAAISHHLVTGVVIICIAAALVLCFVACAKSRTWLYPLAAYYMVIFMASVAGITPAPLIGYGAGPIFGYALAVMVTIGLSRYPNTLRIIESDAVSNAA